MKQHNEMTCYSQSYNVSESIYSDVLNQALGHRLIKKPPVYSWFYFKHPAESAFLFVSGFKLALWQPNQRQKIKEVIRRAIFDIDIAANNCRNQFS